MYKWRSWWLKRTTVLIIITILVLTSNPTPTQAIVNLKFPNMTFAHFGSNKPDSWALDCWAIESKASDSWSLGAQLSWACGNQIEPNLPRTILKAKPNQQNWSNPGRGGLPMSAYYCWTILSSRLRWPKLTLAYSMTPSNSRAAGWNRCAVVVRSKGAPPTLYCHIHLPDPI